MRREDITKFRIQRVLECHENYKFPEFMKMLRRMHGMQRRCVCDDTGISEHRLYYLENGCFRRRLGSDEVRVLSDFYGVDYKIMKKKSDDFIDSGEGKAQGQKTA